MKLLFILVCFISMTSGYCQFKEIDVTEIKKLQVNELRCLDSTGYLNDFCSLGLDGFQIDFYKAFINQKEKEVRLIGRCNWMSVDIFEAIKVENRVINKNIIGVTSYDKIYINNDGFFDVTMKVERNESLFFHEVRFFIREFRVYKLFHFEN